MIQNRRRSRSVGKIARRFYIFLAKALMCQELSITSESAVHQRQRITSRGSIPLPSDLLILRPRESRTNP